MSPVALCNRAFCQIGNGGLLGLVQGSYMLEAGFKVLGAVLGAIADANK